jgi:Ni/Fe-hydrogenase subunit HybB-like protein
MRIPVLPSISGWRPIATILILTGLLAAVARFTFGLGATTNLSDDFPWGLWIGFDFLGIGLAASGFTIVAAVNLFHAKEYEPIVRPAILTAFVGYLLVVLVLIIDLGRPDHFWHPLVMWNPHSVMCEISWCLMLYTTVLSLEFAPIILEKLAQPRSQWAISALPRQCG